MGTASTDKTVSFDVGHGSVSRFKMDVDYVCGPIGGIKGSRELMNVGPMAINSRGKFKLHLEFGATGVEIAGKVSGNKASGTIEAFGEIGTDGGDCGSGKIKWTASRQ